MPIANHRTPENELLESSKQFWHTYYRSIYAKHLKKGKLICEPIKDRNLSTTDAKHILVFEKFWRDELAKALGVPVTQVGPRKIAFRPYRTKKFDVCWPLSGDPKILISIKSMQNAYRNLTNRIEEALGDSAVLRLYKFRAAFGFFFFVLDGQVSKGIAIQGEKQSGIAPFLDRIEEGGDFFELSNVDVYRRVARLVRESRGRQNVTALAEKSLLDLIAPEFTQDGTIHYDALAFAPTTVRRLTDSPDGPSDWECTLSGVDDRLHYSKMVAKLIEVAGQRGFL